MDQERLNPLLSWAKIFPLFSQHRAHLGLAMEKAVDFKTGDYDEFGASRHQQLVSATYRQILADAGMTLPDDQSMGKEPIEWVYYQRERKHHEKIYSKWRWVKELEDLLRIDGVTWDLENTRILARPDVIRRLQDDKEKLELLQKHVCKKYPDFDDWVYLADLRVPKKLMDVQIDVESIAPDMLVGRTMEEAEEYLNWFLVEQWYCSTAWGLINTELFRRNAATSMIEET